MIIAKQGHHIPEESCRSSYPPACAAIIVPSVVARVPDTQSYTSVLLVVFESERTRDVLCIYVEAGQGDHHSAVL